MSIIIPGNQLAKISTKNGVQIHPIVGWDMTSFGLGVAHPIIPTAPNLKHGDVRVIGTFTPEGVLWSEVGHGIADPEPFLRRRAYPRSSDFKDDDIDFSGF